ncbi:23S rRNA (guanosine(2251)-2'-O)-methyltransferase RlmB [Anaerosphaera multitolerans]|uniref:23S rRNA (Guanosine(2251)-2'-O)-methyltransferase RlmB n=1 Tax=Anaerosphaera multitolerans TaxID=2487351 RepID=A0A437S7L4_9FIRM|nr:23S rRNA (guanosine(2251)-2'-O)-methyltransferase RlmB [Anaerosphaera multitolerans]RVU55065.1 23S rRNA (guanosine(2251)-2'-O)-methyltransferase RlmB [Anaerosphaera multitolerans]
MKEYIYGRNPVIEVLKNKRVDKLYVQKGNFEGSIRKIYALAKEQNILITELNKKKLDEMAGGGNHQGVVALVSGYEYRKLEDIIKGSSGRLIMLEKIEDPHNLGAIARSAEAAGFDGIIIPKHKSVYVNDAVYKSSAGAIENISVVIENNLSNTIEKLKKEGYWIYGADMEGKNYNRVDLRGKVCLVIGNEGKGLGHSVKKNCDEIISIPMYGKINSLNASCAASILMFEVLRQNEEVKI